MPYIAIDPYRMDTRIYLGSNIFEQDVCRQEKQKAYS